ncbi:MAG TPA: TonB-dependent receptor [Gemmatimonadales bacterium]|nr:TonB-dependent receptor [Gemmatimonadales bacterium]
MRLQRYVHAAAAASLAVAAPLFAQDSTAKPPAIPADSARPLPPHRPTVVFDSTTLRRLPVDDVLQVPVLVPGVYGLTDPHTFSVRGGLNGDAAVVVDGAVIRNGQRLDAELLPPARGVQSLAVTTDLAPAYLGDVQSGLIEIVTPAGGTKWSGSVRYRADDAGPDLWRNIGYHRLELTGGGTLPAGFTGFAVFALTGQQSLETEKLRDVHAPAYIVSGTDTVIRQPVDFGNPASDTIDLAIPRFVQYSGYCDESSNGAECHGLQLPFTTRGAHAFQAKIQKVYGGDQHVSLTVLAGREQERDFPFTALYNPQNRLAARTASRVFIVDWVHRLPRIAERPLSLNVNLSYQRDERASGVLSLESEVESREPVGGFLAPLEFVTDLSTIHDVTIAGTVHHGVKYLDDVQLTCLQAGPAACSDLVPFLDRNELISAQPYRMNPYAVEQNQYLPFFTSGLDGPFDLSRERRWQGRLGLGWQLAATHQLFAGVDFARFDTRRYAAPGSIAAVDINAYAEQPRRTGVYIGDHAQLGGVELMASLRLDRFDSRASYPVVPGRISSITDAIAVSGADTFRLAPFDPQNPTANFQPASAHSIVSPQLRLLFDAWQGGTVRFTVGRQARIPGFESLFAYKNTDLTQADRTVAFGRSIEPGHTDLLELGAHIAITADQTTFADVALYSQSFSGNAIRLQQFADPGAGGALGYWRVFTNTDRGKVSGFDAMLERRFSDVVTGTVSLSHQGGSALEGARTFASGSVGVRWGNRAPLGALLDNTDFFSVLRFSTNRHYTLQRNSGAGSTIDQDGLDAIEPENSSTLPPFKTLDIRLTRSFPMGRLGGAVFIETTNLLNWTNLTDIFTETGEVRNDLQRARWVDEQVAELETEASRNGLLTTIGTGESAVDLRSPGVCTGWSGRASNGAGGPADCVLLQRAERRFGNGDGLFTSSEYSTSFGAWYDLANAPYRFYGPGRRVRLGVELSF